MDLTILGRFLISVEPRQLVIAENYRIVFKIPPKQFRHYNLERTLLKSVKDHLPVSFFVKVTRTPFPLLMRNLHFDLCRAHCSNGVMCLDRTIGMPQPPAPLPSTIACIAESKRISENTAERFFNFWQQHIEFLRRLSNIQNT